MMTIAIHHARTRQMKPAEPWAARAAGGVDAVEGGVLQGIATVEI
jgi:hypothetical protein